MSTQIGVGVSHHRNPTIAGKAAAGQACRQAAIDLLDDQPDFVMLFATVGYRQPLLLKSVREVTRQAPLIGCSGAGVIAQGIADESNFAVTVLVIKSDEMRFAHGLETGIKASSAQAGAAVGEAITRSTPTMGAAIGTEVDAKALFLFLEGISPNFDEFMEGLRSRTTLEQSIPAIGGFAGDDLSIRETFQYCDDQIVTDGAAWALLLGEVQVASAMSHGCMPVGERHIVTKSSRNAVYEVDGRPVLDLLHSYLTEAERGDWSIAPVMLGWAFDASEASFETPEELQLAQRDRSIIRAMAAKDEQSGAIYMMSDVVEGSSFRISRRDRQKICDTADHMAGSLLAQIKEQSNHAARPKLIFQVECVGRGKLILREPEKLALMDRLQTKIGKDIPWIGLYAFAEIGATSGQNCVHNFTGILTALY